MIDLALILRVTRPARVGPDGVWRATRTPEGAVTQRIWVEAGQVRSEEWGPGSAWAVAHLATLLGGRDRPQDFVPRHPLLRDLHRLFAGLRFARTEAVFEAALPTILEQQVPGVQARSSYRRIVAELGEPAPGPGGLRLPPAPERLAAMPYWALHKFGVERRRADVIRTAARHARRLEEATAMAPDAARRRLTAVPGLGEWSAAEIAAVALGDADAVSTGDYHLKHVVSWALAGEPRGSDDRMLELLEPYRGQRGRAIRLLELAGVQAPRRGPRKPLHRIEAI